MSEGTVYAMSREIDSMYIIPTVPSERLTIALQGWGIQEVLDNKAGGVVAIVKRVVEVFFVLVRCKLICMPQFNVSIGLGRAVGVTPSSKPSEPVVLSPTNTQNRSIFHFSASHTLSICWFRCIKRFFV